MKSLLNIIAPLAGAALMFGGQTAFAQSNDEIKAIAEEGKGTKITISANGEKIAEGEMEATVPARFGIDTFGIGEDSGQPVTNAYAPPFKFSGEINKVVVEVE